MRDLARNQATIYYKLYLGEEEIIDEYGNATGNSRLLYGDLKSLKISVSANKGTTEATAFGTDLDYDKTLSTANTDCELDENSILWIDSDPKDAIEPAAHDFIVLQKAKSLNQVMYAIRKVDVKAAQQNG